MKSEPICGFGICFTSEEWVFVLMSVFGAVIFIVGLVAAGVWLHTLFTAGPASMLLQHRCEQWDVAKSRHMRFEEWFGAKIKD